MDELSSGSDSDYANCVLTCSLLSSLCVDGAQLGSLGSCRPRATSTSARSTKNTYSIASISPASTARYIITRRRSTSSPTRRVRCTLLSRLTAAHRTRTEEDVNEEMRDSIESAARHLYGLIHARFIITSRGLTKMIDKYKKADFGRCPRVLCYGQALLPVGLSDIAYQKAVKLYCPRCEDIYSPKSSRHGAIDGAYFGTTFPHMLFMVHPHLVPAKTTSQSGALGVQMTPAAASVAAPTSTATSGATGTTTTGQAAPNSGAQTGAANAALKAERYRPRVFGFQLHEVARLQRWQEAHRNRYATPSWRAIVIFET